MITSYNERSASVLVTPPRPSPHDTVGGRDRMATRYIKPISPKQFSAAALVRFWAKVDKSKSCWLWLGSREVHGYGVWRTFRAHRVAFTLAKGPIPDGLVIDHLCRTRLCVNPAHMEAVTSEENVARGIGASALNARKSHCINGHAVPLGRKYGKRGGRECPECKREMRQADYRRRSHTCPLCGCERGNLFEHIRRVHHTTFSKVKQLLPLPTRP